MKSHLDALPRNRGSWQHFALRVRRINVLWRATMNSA